MACLVQVPVTSSLNSVKKLEQERISSPKEDIAFTRGRGKGKVQQIKISTSTIQKSKDIIRIAREAVFQDW